jgi:hypothetical protein
LPSGFHTCSLRSRQRSGNPLISSLPPISRERLFVTLSLVEIHLDQAPFLSSQLRSILWREQERRAQRAYST